MENGELNEIIKIVQNVIGPKLESIENTIADFRRSSGERYAALEAKINTLACHEHRDKIGDLEKKTILLESRIESNQQHSERQDRSRDKKENKIWMVLGTVIAGAILYLIQTIWKTI